MSEYRFLPSLPRKMYWSDDVGAHAHCPDCGGSLESEHHSYVMATRQHGEIEINLVGNDSGHFCRKCPIVVLDRHEFGQFAALAASTAAHDLSFVVLGLVDLNAVPEDKKSLPFDEDTNPLPLVRFTNTGRVRSPIQQRQKRSRKTKRKKRKKTKRR